MDTNLHGLLRTWLFGDVDKINVENNLVVFKFYRIGGHQSRLELVTNLAASIANYLCSAHVSLRSPKLLNGYGIQLFEVMFDSLEKIFVWIPLEIIELSKRLLSPFQFHRVFAGFEHHFTTQDVLQEFLCIRFEIRAVHIYPDVGIFSSEKKWRQHLRAFLASAIKVITLQREFFAVVRFLNFVLPGVGFSLERPFHVNEFVKGDLHE